MTDIADIQADIIKIENDPHIFDSSNFSRRANAIDFIDFHIVGRLDSLRQSSCNIPQLGQLGQRAQKLKQKLENIDNILFKELRKNIRPGIAFKDVVQKYVGQTTADNLLNEPGYDVLDNFINCLLCCDALPEATKNRENEMVFYQQTPARIIFQLAEMTQLKADDVFFDIGSGLGQVGMLVNLLTGAKTIGIEYEPAYCDYAKKCAAQFNLTDVEFLNTDALTADYSGGTVFFMYTPFVGDMLQQMLHVLRHQAKKKAIRIFTYGPCSPVISRQCWLKCTNGDGNDIYKLYEFRSTMPAI
ncbi:MAG: class I SAM-dependent methyltransferase [Mucilaginibacter sp.]